jgi:Ca2+/H+ antiporter, TMEM165/GDT1 family
MTWSLVGLFAATLLASTVEFVEAFTIVLAMGLTRGWRSALAGTAAAVAVLAVTAGVAGYALTRWFPKTLLELIVGTLLLVFGLQWLRKAILRSSGLKELHDEEEAFRAETEAALRAGGETRAGLDWFGFVVSFKGVLLEGFEVIFIVITFGINAHSMPVAVAAACVGALLVIVAGIALHKPLSRVPENTIKYVVGLLLSTFGTFWSVEGLGVFKPGSSAPVEWPGGEAMLLVVLAAWFGFSWLAIRTLSTLGGPRLSETPAAVTKEAA